MKQFLLAITAIFFGITSTLEAQELEKKWQLETIQDHASQNIYTSQKSDALDLNKGEFNFTISKDTLNASGDYIYQNNLLVFYFNIVIIYFLCS